MTDQILRKGDESAADLSLIICTVGRLALLERLLASLRRQTRRPLEVLIVDQNPAGTLASLIDRFRDLPLVHLVDLAGKRGLSRARNLGLASARGKLVGFPDDDCWYDPEVLAQVTELFTKRDDLDLICGRTVDAEGAESVSAHLREAAAISRETVFLSGNSNGLFVRRGTALRVGGFDETMGVGAPTPYQSGEETDFILRCLLAGAAARFEPALLIRHDRTDEDAAAAARRAARYAPGFGRVLRLHGFGALYALERALRSGSRGALFLLGGRVDEARHRFAWSFGMMRGYFAAAPARQASGPGLPPRSVAGRAGRPLSKPFGLAFVPLDESALADQVARSLVPRGTGPRVIVTTNLDHVVQLSRNAAFRNAYRRAWVVTADGMPVYLYARLRGANLPCRLTGADLFARLITLLSPERHRCFFVLSSDEIARRIETALYARGFSHEQLAFRVPPWGFERDEAYSAALAGEIRTHHATHLFFGLGSPKSEIWADRYRNAIGDCYVLSVGAALDFFAGTKRRAPIALQRSGLEWAWRLAQEPRRLFRRYFVDSWTFLWLAAADAIRPARDLTSDRMQRLEASHDV